jgi:hypothetical protein
MMKIVDTSVERALFAKDEQCRLHAKRLDSFELNQRDVVKEMQETNKLLAVLADNMKDMKTDKVEIFAKINKNSEKLVQHDEQIKTQNINITEISNNIKETRTLKWTTVSAVALVIIEFLINKFGGGK